MRIVQFQVTKGGETIIILMEDGRMFLSLSVDNDIKWFPISLPEHPMGLPKNPLGPPPEDVR